MGRLLSSFLLCLALYGCATVKTSAPSAGAVAPGVSYYLPRKDMKITVERTVLKLEEAKQKVAATTKAAGEAATSAKAAAAKLKQQEVLLSLLAAGTDAWKDVEAARATAAAEKTLADGALREANAALTLAKADQARVEANAGALCLYKYDSKLELLSAVPDHEMRFTATFSHNVLRDDDGKLAVTADGLLTNSNVVATDRSGDIIVELAGAIGGFGGTGAPDRLKFTATSASPDCAVTAEKFIYQFDPVAYEATNAKLFRAGFPIQLNLQNMHQEGPTCLAPIPKETDEQRSARLAECASKVIGTAGQSGALFYRSAVPVTVILEQCLVKPDGTFDCTKRRPVDAALVLIPQLGPISYIPMRSSAFVKSVDDVTFSNGSISSWNATRPSGALEIVRLPVRVLTALISVPAQILSLRVDLSDQDKALAISQEAQISAQQKLSVLKECIAAAEREEKSTAACFTE